MIEPIEFPGLYYSASKKSENSQKKYLRLIRIEYLILIISAILALDYSQLSSYNVIYTKLIYGVGAFLFIALISLTFYRFFTKPEQEWYRSRALAESIKTMTWRYCMQCTPYDHKEIANANNEFRNTLFQLVQINSKIGDQLSPEYSANDQITRSMRNIRDKSLEDKKIVYATLRIDDQINWYASKALYNKKRSILWLSIGIFIYLVALTLCIARMNFPEWKIWPIDILAVSASSIIGWIQIKKFNELAASYTLTAHEIGIIKSELNDIKENNFFENFVNNSELAFSREHTQWIARSNE